MQIRFSYKSLICLSHSQSSRSSQSIIFTMKAFIFSSALLALTVANTCDDCTAVINKMVEGLTSEEGIMAQQVCAESDSGKTSFKINLLFDIVPITLCIWQAILVGGLCPTAENPAYCEAYLPDFWRAIALTVWPVYYNAEVSLSWNFILN